jgi:hypothetical protein
MYSYQSSSVSRYMFLTLAPSKCVPFVLIMLFQRSLEETMSMVHVASSKRIIDQIAANSDTNAVRVLFLWMMINGNSSISDCPVGRDVRDLFGGKEKDCVGPIGDA